MNLPSQVKTGLFFFFLKKQFKESVNQEDGWGEGGDVIRPQRWGKGEDGYEKYFGVKIDRT